MSTKKPILAPRGFPCSFLEADAGPFIFDGNLCHKTEYRRPDGTPEAYCESGEAFHAKGDIVVQPVSLHWRFEDEL